MPANVAAEQSGTKGASCGGDEPATSPSTDARASPGRQSRLASPLGVDLTETASRQTKHRHEASAIQLERQLPDASAYEQSNLVCAGPAKRLLRRRYPQEVVRACYQIDTLKTRLQRDGIDLEAVPGFSAIDEVRLINNAIKHEGKVTAVLANYPGWTKGQELQNLGPAFERLAPRVPEYLENLGLAVIPDRDPERQ